MSWWEMYTCVRFRPASASDSVKLAITNTGGCSSFVGYQGDTAPYGLQQINLAESRCFGQVCHQILNFIHVSYHFYLP